MHIHPVSGGKQLKKFISLPYKLRKDDPVWIPPLRIEQKKLFDSKQNSIFRQIKYQFFLLKNERQVIGRIAAYINPGLNDYLKEYLGFIGYYECIDDPQAGQMLLKAAQDWLFSQDAKIMRGQWNFETQDIGLVIDGYDIPPVILSSQNPPCYNDHFEQFGMRKAKDLLVYNCNIAAGYTMPKRFIHFTDRIAKRYKVRIRPINMKNLKEETRLIVHLTNKALAGNWGFYPVHESEADEIAREFKKIIDPKIVLFAEVDGQSVGYILALPDINCLLKDMNGRLFPIGLLKLLTGMKKINRYRIWSLVILKPYQQKGVSALLFRRLNEVLSPKKPYVEANWVLEDNALMNNAMQQLNFDLVKKYRIYEKEIK